MKEKILELRGLGKTYQEIKDLLNCSKGTISYYCGESQLEKSLNRQKKNRKGKPLLKKLNQFKQRTIRIKTNDFQRKREGGRDYNFKYEDLIKKVESNPICYLSGRVIDISSPETYNFDHITPVSKEGLNTLENLGLTCKEANQAKNNLTVEEFLTLCKDVLEFNGFIVKRR